MANRRVSRKRERPDPARVEKVREAFYRRGETVQDWALSRGYRPPTVYAILRGERACARGLAHRIAVELGLKDVGHANDAEPSGGTRHRQSAGAV